MGVQAPDIIITFKEPYFKTLEDMSKIATTENIKQIKENLNDILQQVDDLKFNVKTFFPKELVHVKIVESIKWLDVCIEEINR